MRKRLAKFYLWIARILDKSVFEESTIDDLQNDADVSEKVDSKLTKVNNTATSEDVQSGPNEKTKKSIPGRLWTWSNEHLLASGILAAILLLLILVMGWIIVNRNTWIVFPFKMGNMDSDFLSGEEVATQLIAELNQVSAGTPRPSLIFFRATVPQSKKGPVITLDSLKSNQCNEVLEGPSRFEPYQQISFPTIRSSSEESLLDFEDFAVANVNIPTRQLIRTLFSLSPFGDYREVNGQVSEHENELDITVVLNKPALVWHVSGPTEAFPEMLEYLAYRMVLDLNPEIVQDAGLIEAPSDFELAFSALGMQRYRKKNYNQAKAFFEIADRLRPLQAEGDAMLGLSYYHDSESQVEMGDDECNQVLKHLAAALIEDPNGDRSHYRPYYACMLSKCGFPGDADREFNIFNDYLAEREKENLDIRVNELKQLSQRGAGWLIHGNDEDIIFTDEKNLFFVMTSIREITSPRQIVERSNQTRQLVIPSEPFKINNKIYNEIYYVTQDGSLVRYRYRSEQSTRESEFSTLIRGASSGGTRQIGMSTSESRRINLFILDVHGRIYWCDPDASESKLSACPPSKPLELDPGFIGQQIYPFENKLFILDDDGNIWALEIFAGGKASQPVIVLTTDDVMEFIISDNEIIYMLHENGDISRSMIEQVDSGVPVKIDDLTSTDKIVEENGILYLLKKDNSIWRVSDLDKSPDFKKIYDPQNNIIIRDLYVTSLNPSEDEESSASAIFILSDSGQLMRAIDDGSSSLDFNQIYPSK